MKLKIVDERKLLEIRGKMLVGAATVQELHDFLTYTAAIEGLVEEASMEDFYGTEGYRHRLGWD